MIDLDAVMNIIWRAGGYHLQETVDYEAYFKSLQQAVRKHVGRISPTHRAVLVSDPSGNHKRSVDQSYRMERFLLPMAGMIKLRSLLRSLDAEGFKVIVCPRSEPYDVMAYTKEKLGSDWEMTFLSNDKRAWGLVSENFQVYWPYSKNPAMTYITPKILSETQEGLNADQYREMLVLSEIEGIGIKKASKVLKTYGSLENTANNLVEIDGSVGRILREKLKSDGRRAYRHVFPHKIRSIGVSLSDLKSPH